MEPNPNSNKIFQRIKIEVETDRKRLADRDSGRERGGGDRYKDR